jgi:hypothetical protein
MSSFRIFTPTCKTNLNLCGKSITLNFTLKNDWAYATGDNPKNAIIISTTTADPTIALVYNGIVFNIPANPPAKAGTKFTSYISQKSIIDDELYYLISDKNTDVPTFVSFPVNSSSCVTNTLIENEGPTP